ncbi:hypothetical protein RHGRI_014094 [Rhododendron griersonianum]|uniref:No apical meristem-associated C-terminal domain-containing protein n=1 Tax=Rhododendron griersonianum TaxID=479676 RepID=A0AAV6K817_9ERIC|nr:hypothetical protein RHGRI_014094 [Rhododendron griersonianum]
MPKGKIHPNQPSQSLDTTTTEDPSKNGVRCGKWILRSTKVRRGRGQHPSLKFEPTTPLSENRKRSAPSPTPSANSVIGENNIPLAYPKAVKFRNQGLDHFEELDELLSSSLANGAFARPNTQPPPTRDEEVVMYGKGNPIKREDNMSMGKRKSDGSGGSTAKATKFERRDEAYEKFAFSQQMKGEYYQLKAQNQSAQNNLEMKECHAFLKSIKHIVGEDKYLDAYSHLVDQPRWSFLTLDVDERMAWVYRKH